MIEIGGKRDKGVDFPNLFNGGPMWAKGGESGPESEVEDTEYSINLEDSFAHSWRPERYLGGYGNASPFGLAMNYT